jgi:hypothetical protein
MSPRISFADDGATDPATSLCNVASVRPRLAYASRSWPQMRCFCWCAFHTREHATHPTAGSRQPLLLRDADSVKSARYAMHTRTSARAAGVSPPWGTIRTRCCESRAMFGDWRTHNQERRASARRGVRYEHVAATVEQCLATGEHTTKSGARQPAVVCDTNALLRELTVRQSANTHPGAAGVSPPCARSVERCLRFVADHLQARSPTHGWLTPAALGRRRGCFCRCAFHTRDYATHSTAGLRQPLLDGASWLYEGDGYCQGVAVRQAAFTFAIC